MPREKIKQEITISNPEYEEWYDNDQQVLAYMLLSLSKEIMGHVAIYNTVASAWGIIEGMFTSRTRAHSINIRIMLATMKKGNNLITKYASKAHTLAHEMTLADNKMDDEDLIHSCFSRL
jgi:hypothetical protein